MRKSLRLLVGILDPVKIGFFFALALASLTERDFSEDDDDDDGETAESSSDISTSPSPLAGLRLIFLLTNVKPLLTLEHPLLQQLSLAVRVAKAHIAMMIAKNAAIMTRTMHIWTCQGKQLKLVHISPQKIQVGMLQETNAVSWNVL